MRPAPPFALTCLALASACSYQVIELGAAPTPVPRPAEPLALTVTVRAGSFDGSRLSPEGVALHFADGLRASGLFADVIHPAPPGPGTVWQIELSASDSGSEPDSNFWKALLGYALPPLLAFVELENDYRLELDALLLRERRVFTSYRANAAIRHRYRVYANRAQMERAALESLARRATQQILAALTRDADRLRAQTLSSDPQGAGRGPAPRSETQSSEARGQGAGQGPAPRSETQSSEARGQGAGQGPARRSRAEHRPGGSARIPHDTAP